MVVSDIKAVRALASTLRIRILELLRDGGAASASQLAHSIGESASKIDYHLKQLEKHGFVNLVEVRSRGNLHERVYAPTARQVVVEMQADGQQAECACDALEAVRREVLALMEQDIGEMRRDGHLSHSLFYESYYLTREEAEELSKQVISLFGRYADRKPGEGLIRCNIAFLTAVKLGGMK
jgi:DNA-binding transcriptional ArsR family regulator